MRKILFLLCVTLVALSSCNTVNKLDDVSLKKSWTHAYEEDKDGIQVFKPTHSQEFAPSMYRLVIDLKENNEAEYLVLSPVDAHYMESGKWSYDTDTRQLTITDNDDKTIHAFEVIEVTDNLLKVKAISKQ